MLQRPLHQVAFLHLFALTAVAAEPSVATNGWTNTPGVVEGTVTARPVDATAPKPPLGYVEYLPKGYSAADKSKIWPLIVFISGLGEVGDGTNTDANHHQLFTCMTRHGPLYQVETNKWDFPAVVVAVQQPGLWNNASILGTVFSYMQGRYHLDSNRLYLTGLCDGAVGVMNFSCQHPGLLAAIMPIECGDYPNSGEAAGDKDLPIWSAQGYNDIIGGRLTSIAWINQITAAALGSSDVMATYPGYDGNTDHEALSSNSKTHAPDEPDGAAFTQVATLTKGSSWVSFKTTSYGSAEFGTWGSSNAYPYARLAIGKATPSYTVALGKSDGVYLTKPYAGDTTTTTVSVVIPKGNNLTAYFDHATHKWLWVNGQPWDRNQDDKHIFTMFWYMDHEEGWRETYNNGYCWDWLLTQVKMPTGKG